MCNNTVKYDLHVVLMILQTRRSDDVAEGDIRAMWATTDCVGEQRERDENVRKSTTTAERGGKVLDNLTMVFALVCQKYLVHKTSFVLMQFANL